MEEILVFYRTKVKRESKIAFLTAIIIGFIAHMYKFTNTLLNHDSLYNFYNPQNLIGSGRWLLSVACSLGGYFDLPWINGILSILFIALTSVVLVKTLEIKSPVLIAIVSGLLVTFPSVTSILCFEFTADGFMLSMLLASLAAYFVRFEAKPIHLAAAVICICCSCGIYQAFVSFAAVLAIVYLLLDIIEKKHSDSQYLKWTVSRIGVMVSGLVLFYVCWKICLHFQKCVPSDYAGISTMGLPNFSELIADIKDICTDIASFVLGWNIFKHGLTFYCFFNIAVLAVLTFIFIFAVFKNKIYKDGIKVLLIIACIIVLPLCIYMWKFTSTSLHYATRMLQSISVLYIFAAVLADRFVPKKIGLFCTILFFATIWNFTVMSNTAYYSMQKTYNTSLESVSEMAARIHELDPDDTVKEVLVVGDLTNNVAFDDFSDPEAKNRILVDSFEKNLLFDSEHVIMFLNEYYYLDLCSVTDEKRENLLPNDKIVNMPEWPAKDGIQLVDDTIIIKIAD